MGVQKGVENAKQIVIQQAKEIAALRQRVAELEQENAVFSAAWTQFSAHAVGPNCLELDACTPLEDPNSSTGQLAASALLAAGSASAQLGVALTRACRQHAFLELALERALRQKSDLEEILATTLEHNSLIENQLYDSNRTLQSEIEQRREAENKLQGLVDLLVREKDDLEGIVRTIIEHGDAVAEHWYVRAQSADVRAATDGLTGLANRRALDECLAEQWSLLATRGQCLTLVLADIDQFKAYNDALGHPAGDRCLQQVATTLQAVAQPWALQVARYGGEEFALVLPGVELATAAVLAEEVRRAVEQLQLPHPQGERPGGGRGRQGNYVSLSVGVACAWPDPGLGGEGATSWRNALAELIAQADSALYLAKDQGRNRVVVATPPGSRGEARV